MRPSVIGEEGIQPYKFSTCSHQQFNQWMSDGHALCLLNKPNQVQEETLVIYYIFVQLGVSASRVTDKKSS
jgi:hypothetical protein